MMYFSMAWLVIVLMYFVGYSFGKKSITDKEPDFIFDSDLSTILIKVKRLDEYRIQVEIVNPVTLAHVGSYVVSINEPMFMYIAAGKGLSLEHQYRYREFNLNKVQ